MKPTHGLVPYTGIMPIEIYVDHTGPMTATVKDNALLLEVIAGPDGYDPRQFAPKVHPYTELLGNGAGGLRIGVVKEGFGHPQSEAAVDAKVRQAGALFPAFGAKVTDISIPAHLAGRRALATDRRGRAHPDHDVGRRLRAQPPGSLRDQPDGFPARLAAACRRDVRDHQALHHARHLHPSAPWLALLRQGHEHHPSTHRRLRHGARLRSAADADHAYEVAADAGAGAPREEIVGARWR